MTHRVETPYRWPAAFSVDTVAAASFTLYTALKATRPGADLVVYIEGDGHAWLTRDRLSSDPTPRDTRLRDWAMRDPRPNVLYLARPCQFVGTFQPPCTPRYWDTHRLSPRVITSLNEAVTQAARRVQATHVALIGYSGGGGAAVLLGARRADVTAITTVAGLLDTRMYSALHHVTPLSGSSNPRDAARAVAAIRQCHITGGRDTVIPAAIADSYRRALPATAPVTIISYPDATHTTGWPHRLPCAP